MKKLLKFVGGNLPLYIKRTREFGTVFNIGDFPLTLTDLDAIILNLSRATESREILVFANEELRIFISNILSNISARDQEDGVSYGVFDDSSGKATEVRFTGFRRGEFDFYVIPSNDIQDSVMVPNGEDTESLTERIKKSIVLCQEN